MAQTQHSCHQTQSVGTQPDAGDSGLVVDRMWGGFRTFAPIRGRAHALNHRLIKRNSGSGNKNAGLGLGASPLIVNETSNAKVDAP